MQAAGELAQLLHREVELVRRPRAAAPAASGSAARLLSTTRSWIASETSRCCAPSWRLRSRRRRSSIPASRMRPREALQLLARLRALEPERDELGEVAEPALGVGAEGVGRVGGDEDEPPGPPARDDRRRRPRCGSRCARIISAARPRTCGVVVDPRGPAGPGDDRRQPSLSASGTDVPTVKPRGSPLVPAADGDAPRRRRSGSSPTTRRAAAGPPPRRPRRRSRAASAPEATSVATRRSAACSSASSDSAPSPVPGAPGAMVLAWSIVADASARRDPIPRASQRGRTSSGGLGQRASCRGAPHRRAEGSGEAAMLGGEHEPQARRDRLRERPRGHRP